MELDELKMHLKQKPDLVHPVKTPDDIKALLKKDTQSVLGKIKRSLWFEIIFCIVFIVVCVVMSVFTNYWSLRIYFSIFTCVPLLFFIVLVYLLKKIDHVNDYPMPVKDNIETLYHILQEFVKRCFQFTMALIPVCFILSVWLGAHDPDRSQDNNGTGMHFNNILFVVIFLVVYFIALTTGVYFFTKWYLKKLYGNYIQQLAGLIKEMDE